MPGRNSWAPDALSEVGNVMVFHSASLIQDFPRLPFPNSAMMGVGMRCRSPCAGPSGLLPVVYHTVPPGWHATYMKGPSSVEALCGSTRWKHFVETHCGNTRWKHTVETHCGNTRWKHTVETHCGNSLWRRTVETHCGNTLWKHTVEKTCGNTLWKHYVDTHV